MVENTAAFESSPSCSLGDSLLGDQNSTDYEVVSHNGSDIRSASRNAFVGSGILILNGAGEDTHENGSVLSVPGTDSLPTDVGTLNGQEIVVPRKNGWAISKYGAVLLGSVLLALGYTTYTWRLSSLQLQEQIAQQQATIQRLEQEVQESKMQLDFMDESEYVTLFDNCWLKAKARWCDSGAPGSLPSLFGEASKLVTDTMNSFTDSMKEVPQAASSEFKAAADAVTKVTGALSVFVGAAGDAMVAELQEFSDNPMDYMAEAVKGAPSQEAEVTGKGVDEVIHVVTGKTFYMTDEQAAALKEAAVSIEGI